MWFRDTAGEAELRGTGRQGRGTPAPPPHILGFQSHPGLVSLTPGRRPVAQVSAVHLLDLPELREELMSSWAPSVHVRVKEGGLLGHV